MNAFVVRTEFTDPEHGNEFLDSMREGLARIGWSYQDDLDLASIVQANNQGQWDTLSTDHQQPAWRCHGFIDRAARDDYLFYPNVPVYGQFVVAKITGEYVFLSSSQAIRDDFRSARPCELGV